MIEHIKKAHQGKASNRWRVSGQLNAMNDQNVDHPHPIYMIHRKSTVKFQTVSDGL